VNLTVVASDPEGNNLTVTFTDLSGAVWTSPNTRSATSVAGNIYTINRNQYNPVNFQVRVNVSDGTSTTTLTRTWDGDYMSSPASCTLVSTP